MGVTRKLPQIVKKGYLLPYNNYNNRIATSRFVQDIPLEKNHPTYKTIKRIEHNLSKVTCPKLILGGGKDFCFNNHFYNRWREIYPTAKLITLKKLVTLSLKTKKKRFFAKLSAFINSHRAESFSKIND